MTCVPRSQSTGRREVLWMLGTEVLAAHIMQSKSLLLQLQFGPLVQGDILQSACLVAVTRIATNVSV